MPVGDADQRPQPATQKQDPGNAEFPERAAQSCLTVFGQPGGQVREFLPGAGGRIIHEVSMAIRKPTATLNHLTLAVTTGCSNRVWSWTLS